MEKVDRAEVIFHIGMYVFMIMAAGIFTYEIFNLSKNLLGIIDAK